MKGLIIRQPWIDLIFEGKKTWEIRGSNTKIRGKIALIQSGTKTIVGEAEIIDCIAIDGTTYQNRKAFHYIEAADQTLPYPKTYAWVLQHAKRYRAPIPYNHPQGAVIWVELGEI